MHNQPKARFVVPAATAILLTFGRDGMLPFEGVYTVLDQAMNIFVVVVAPLFALKDIYPRLLRHNPRLILLFLMFASWVSLCILLGSPNRYWPAKTLLITIVLSVLLASQISRFELRRLRRFVLLIAGVFSVYALIFAQSSISRILSGTLISRLGGDLNPANVIKFPRVMYTLIITCLISLVIEKNTWVRIYSATMMILPILIALATGGRGGMVGFMVAALAFVFGLRRMKGKAFYAVLAVGVMAFIGYFLVIRLIPSMAMRIIRDQDSNRFSLWSYILSMDITWFGRGVTAGYPHNIFLEFLYNYGIVGLFLWLIVLVTILVLVYRYYNRTRHEEALWVIALLVLQMTAQQFSLDIFYGSLWAAIFLPLGFSWDYFHPRDEEGRNRISEYRMSHS